MQVRSELAAQAHELLRAATDMELPGDDHWGDEDEDDDGTDFDVV